VIGRGQLAKAAAWQLLFAARGAGAETVRKAAEDGLMVLKGFRVDDLRDLVAGRDGADPEAARLPGAAQPRRTPPQARRARLHRLRHAAGDRGGDRARARLRRRARVDLRDRGRRLHRPLARGAHGDGKAAAVRELAAQEGFDLEASTAYSDSHTDLPFLEAVGNPVVVNPDRQLRRIAEDRGWPMLEFSELAYPSTPRLRPALLGIPLVLGAGAAVWAARRRAA
jgi:hypothetical protein